MAQQKVFIGRIWPVMPNWVRITVGTHEEMEQFQAAFQKVMRGTTAFSMQAGEAGQKAATTGTAFVDVSVLYPGGVPAGLVRLRLPPSPHFTSEAK